MKTKFDICDQVSYFNDASQKVESSTVQGIKIIATKVHANEDGVDVLDECVAIYTLKNGINTPENTLFASEEECTKHYKELFAAM